MKTIRMFLAIGFLFTQIPSAFALSEYEEGYQWAKEQKLTDSTKCHRDLHKDRAGQRTEDGYKDFSTGCLDYLIDSALASSSN